jgi:hypothetical protein
MTDKLSKSNSSGYALLDALVGLALAGIVTTATTTSLSHLASIRQRFAEDGTRRDQLLAVRAVLRQVAGEVAESAAAGAATVQGNRIQFAMQGGIGEHIGSITLSIERVPPNGQVLILRRADGFGSVRQDVVLGPLPRLELAYSIDGEQGGTSSVDEIAELKRLREVRLTAQTSKGSEVQAIVAPILRHARVRCIAQPFLRECLP